MAAKKDKKGKRPKKVRKGKLTKPYVKNSYWMYTIRIDPSSEISKKEIAY